MTTAIVATAFGGPEVLDVTHPELPAVGPGQVRVAVRAAGTNPVDFKVYSGEMGSDPSQLPMRLGYEAAGVVAEVGDGAHGAVGPVSVGDEVVVYRTTGAYADELVVDGDLVLPKPARLSFEEASGLMLAGTTAVHLLSATAVQAEEVVLVHGAAGGVGRLAVQLAVHTGAHVIGTAGERNHAWLRAHGAVPVTYGDGLVERVREAAAAFGRGVDAALDCVGTDEAVDASLALVAERARIATIAAFGRAQDDGIKVLGGGPGADPGTQTRRNARRRLVDLAAAGDLEVSVAATFPLERAADAHRLLMEGHAGGKVVLVP